MTEKQSLDLSEGATDVIGEPASRRKRSVARLGGKGVSDGMAKTPRLPPRTGKALATYDLFLSAAGELLGEVGFEKLTMNAICTRANLTPPALYRYFSDKYDISKSWPAVC